MNTVLQPEAAVAIPISTTSYESSLPAYMTDNLHRPHRQPPYPDRNK